MSRARVAEVGSGAALVAAGATVLLAWARPSLDPRGADASFDALVASVAALLAWACVVWLALGTLLVVLAQARGVPGRVAARVAAAVTPRSFRRAVEVALGATLVSGPLAAPALAAPVTPPGPAVTAFGPTTNESARPVAVRRPSRAHADAHAHRHGRRTFRRAARTATATRRSTERRRVRGRRRHNGGAPHPGGADRRGRRARWRHALVDRRPWPRPHRDQREDRPRVAAVVRREPSVIGRDPNLLHPGERLRPPPDGG